MLQVPVEFIFAKLKVMVTFCGVVGSAKNRSNAPKEGFFPLTSIASKYRLKLDRGAIYGYEESITKI